MGDVVEHYSKADTSTSGRGRPPAISPNFQGSNKSGHAEGR